MGQADLNQLRHFLYTRSNDCSQAHQMRIFDTFQMAETPLINPLLLLSSVFPSIRVFSNELAPRLR